MQIAYRPQRYAVASFLSKDRNLPGILETVFVCDKRGIAFAVFHKRGPHGGGFVFERRGFGKAKAVRRMVEFRKPHLR